MAKATDRLMLVRPCLYTALAESFGFRHQGMLPVQLVEPYGLSHISRALEISQKSGVEQLRRNLTFVEIGIRDAVYEYTGA